MVLRHVVLMKIGGDPDAEFVARMDRAVADMAASIPEVLASSGGSDVSGKSENFDYAIVFDFADAAAYERYRVHPVHTAFIEAFMRSKPMEKVRIQLSI